MWNAMLAITEVEAAAMAFLEALEEARRAMRDQLVTYREGGKEPQ